MNTFYSHVRRTCLQKFPFHYFAHGIIEECGEVFEEIENGSDNQIILKELGDVLWYVTAFCIETEISIEWRELDHDVQIHNLMLNASRLSGRVKKSMRKDKSLQDFIPAMTIHLQNIINDVSAICSKYNTTIFKVSELNIKKLTKRAKLGTIRGDGNNR